MLIKTTTIKNRLNVCTTKYVGGFEAPYIFSGVNKNGLKSVLHLPFVYLYLSMKYAFIILSSVLLLSSFSVSAQTEKFSNYAFTHATISSYISPFRINGMHENKHLKKTSVGNVIGQTLFWTSGLVLVLAEPATCLIENL